MNNQSYTEYYNELQREEKRKNTRDIIKDIVQFNRYENKDVVIIGSFKLNEVYEDLTDQLLKLCVIDRFKEIHLKSYNKDYKYKEFVKLVGNKRKLHKMYKQILGIE
ncbi:MAG TPA: hypothetical protein VI911_09135 [Patescibacteria group bacterium]|nr:MAG: hypothetical protein UR43_C0005G0004 [candidate division TM6 bacterium GW2011_GWF2_33_332]HLD91162.1 hypothetical protein [Patescibacteria group bacterium]